MDIKEILSICDHTLLKQECTQEQIKTLCDEGIKYKTASVCIPPTYVKFAKEYMGDKLPICTVIGFPNGNYKTSVKCFETAEAVKDGADEIDMVINIGWLRDKKYECILDEINQIKTSCNGKLLKVIIETCLLTDDEIKIMCDIVNKSNADYIKTSTGFSTAGATKDAVRIFAANMNKSKGIKAAGGISSIEDAEDFINIGATRLGTSRIVKIVKEQNLLGE